MSKTAMDKSSFVKKEHKFYEQVDDYDREHFNTIDFLIIKNYNEELCRKLHLEVPTYPFWENEKDEQQVDKYVKHERIQKNETLAIVLTKMEQVALLFKQVEKEENAKAMNSRRE